MKKRIAILLTLTVLMLSFTGCGEKENVPELLYPVETANAVCVVKKAPLTVVQSTGGYVVPECVDLKFDYETSAYRVAVELGDHVTAGQLLMELNPELEDNIKRLELSIVREQTEYDYDLEQFNKQIKNLRNFANMLGSSYDGRMMRLQMQEMQLNFDRSHSELEKKITEEREELKKMQQEAADAKVFAPCDGTIVYQSVYQDGDPIAKNKTFLTIAKDNTRLLACGYISASDYASYSSVKAKIGDAVYDVTYLPYTEEEVYNLERTGNKYDSYFKADLPDSVEVGDYVQFVFERTTANPVISVPNSAVIKYGTQYSVMLVRDGYMESREVTVGESGLNDTEITSGLSEGDVVYVAKNLARYGVTYQTKTPTRVTYTEYVGCTGAKKVARITEPYKNPVPGKITEIHVKGISDIMVKKGDPIFTVKASVGRADWEQAKVDLRKYTDDVEEAKKSIEKKIEELEKRMKKISKSSLEYALAELDLKDYKEEIAKLEEDAAEEIAKLQERIDNFEKWNDQSVTIYAEKDCVISSISKYKVGSDIAEGQILFDMYDLNSYCICISAPAEGTRVRYGQKVTLSSAVDSDEIQLPAHIISAENVRPSDVNDKNVIYVALDDPDRYADIGPTGVLYYDEYEVADCLVIDETLVYHDPKAATTQKTNQNQQGQGQGGNNPWGGWGGFGPQEEEPIYEEAESYTFDSEEHATTKGKAYVWVYDANGCAVKRYVRVMRVAKGLCWIVDGVAEGDTILVH
ncbi:MAG: hypothetical protein J5531_01880 [Lachnospiraceae bacterium]|nr:hypothetical protein [Lachnospiraceae bacterium]